MDTIVKVEGMRCEHCSARVEKALKAIGYGVEVDLAKGEVKVIADSIDAAEVKTAIEDLGFDVK